LHDRKLPLYAYIHAVSYLCIHYKSREFFVPFQRNTAFYQSSESPEVTLTIIILLKYD